MPVEISAFAPGEGISTLYQHPISVPYTSTLYQQPISLLYISTLYHYFISAPYISTLYKYSISVPYITTPYQYSIPVPYISILCIITKGALSINGGKSHGVTGVLYHGRVNFFAVGTNLILAHENPGNCDG